MNSIYFLQSPTMFEITGIRMMSICPSLTDTEINQSLSGENSLLQCDTIDQLAKKRHNTLYSQK